MKSSKESPTAPERLHKVLARAGISSRRAAEALILAGRVRVNGKVVGGPGVKQGLKVDPQRDAIEIDGAPVRIETAAPETWAIHKPPGMMTTLSDPQGRPTVRRLVGDLPLRLYPVGRLDWDASGLLLMSNDGELTHRLTHPRYGIPRVYLATVKGRVDDSTLAKLRGQLELDDGPVQTVAVELVSGDARRSALRITVAEGRNHLIKRLCGAVGHEVERLIRLSYGGVELGPLPASGRRKLETREVASLRRAVGLES
jgi:23S rRNA pseudouridine2605 synthase